MIKTSIIGLGRHGMRYFNAINKIKNVNVGAIVDKNKNVVNELLDVIFYDDLEKMLNEYEPDLVIISTNGPSHFDIAKKAMNSGVKKLVISKPITTSFSDAIKIKDLAVQTNSKIAVDHGLRYDETYNWIYANLNKQTWGKVLQINIERSGIGLGCLATHSFDLANYLFDKPPIRVSAWVDKPIFNNPRGKQFIDPGGLVILQYDNGERAVISQIENTIRGIMLVKIFCEDACILVDVKNKKLVVETFDNSEGRKLDINPHGIDVNHDTTKLMQKIIEDVISSSDLSVNYLDGVEAVKILIAAYGSSENSNNSIKLNTDEILKIDKNLPVT